MTRRKTRAISEEGNRYGSLEVLRRSGSDKYPSGRSKPMWDCLCDCGNTARVSGQSLRAGTTKSCGCLRESIKVDWTGAKQGKLEVLSRYHGEPHANGRTPIRWNCLCECGSEIVLSSTALREGSSSCGCGYKRRPKNPDTVNRVESPTHITWRSMIDRCYNPSREAYKYYGALGVTVCERWKTYENFLEDMGERPDGMTLNRVKGAKEYSPENCEWATRSVQAYDQRIRETNKSGVTGVCWDKRVGKWEAYISVNKKKVSLGFYNTIKDASEVRSEAELEYYGFNKD